LKEKQEGARENYRYISVPCMAGVVKKQETYAVIIVGVGAHGSAALYQLAKQGLQVIWCTRTCI
jgi:ribulose 1,5-bisphosphate synthetase/thiazole synthase